MRTIEIDDSNIIIRQEPDDDTITCNFCHRVGNETVPLEARVAPQRYIRRRTSGDIANVQAGSPLCKQCYAFLTDQSKKDNWQAVWPSSFYTCFTDNNYLDCAIWLRDNLPRDIKNLYRHIPNLNVNLDCPGIFKENTRAQKAFHTAINKYKAGVLIDIMQRTACPSTRCPLGCFTHIETSNTISFNHVINLFCPKFNFCNANSQNLKSKRPEFPKVEDFLVWQIKPATLVDPVKGLGVVICDDHKDLKKDFIHVMKNPIYRTTGRYQTNAVDANAPVLQTTNTIKGGNNSTKHPSYPKFLQYSNQTGSSTFSLAPHTKGAEGITPNVYTANSNLLAYRFRSDIQKYAAKNPTLDHDYYEKVLKGRGGVR